MRIFHTSLAIILTILVSACATGPKHAEVSSSMPTLNASQGRIFFYRNASIFGAALAPSILLNDKIVGDSQTGGFFYVDQIAGPQTVSTATEVEKKLTFILDPGQTRYVRTYVGFGIIVGRVYPELVNNTEGTKEIVETNYTGGITKSAK
jgi:outer membrane murein-binding lipoprotein Lpp